MVRCGKSAKSWNISPIPRFSGGTKTFGPGDLLAVEKDPARGRTLDPGRDPEQGRLAATRRSKQAEDLGGRDVEADAVERQRPRHSGATPISKVRRAAKVTAALPRPAPLAALPSRPAAGLRARAFRNSSMALIYALAAQRATAGRAGSASRRVADPLPLQEEAVKRVVRLRRARPCPRLPRRRRRAARPRAAPRRRGDRAHRRGSAWRSRAAGWNRADPRP